MVACNLPQVADGSPYVPWFILRAEMSLSDRFTHNLDGAALGRLVILPRRVQIPNSLLPRNGGGEPQLAPFGAFQLVNGRPSITRPLSRWQNLSVA